MKRLILIFCSILSFNFISAQPGSEIPPTIFLSDFLNINKIDSFNNFKFYIEKHSATDNNGNFNKRWYLIDSKEEAPIKYGNEIAKNTIFFHLMNSMDNPLNTHIYSIKISERNSKKSMIIYFALVGLHSVENMFILVIKNLKFQEGKYFFVIDYKNSSAIAPSLGYNVNFHKRLLKNSYEEYLDLSDIKNYKITKKVFKKVFKKTRCAF